MNLVRQAQTYTPEPTYPCRTCGHSYVALEMNKRAGKVDTQCVGCRRTEWTRFRRERLIVRRCNSCKHYHPFTMFPEKTGPDGQTRLGMACKPCDEEIETRKAERAAKRMRVGQQLDLVRTAVDPPLAVRTAMGGHARVQQVGRDWSVVAQSMLFPGQEDYRKLTELERHALWALTKELVRQFAPETWNTGWDANPSPRDRRLRVMAQAFIERHKIPEALEPDDDDDVREPEHEGAFLYVEMTRAQAERWLGPELAFPLFTPGMLQETG